MGDSSGASSTEDGAGRRGKRSAHTADWRDWWNANAGPLREARPHRIKVTSESGLDGIGSDPMPFVEPPSRRTVTTLLVPTLRHVLATTDRKQPETIAASMVALAKASDDPADVGRIAAAFADSRLADSAHEAAAIALGCFRRTKPPPAFDGAFYDGVRTKLFGVLDDRNQSRRTRGFAALAIGILGDQANDRNDVFATDGRMVIRGLWLRLERPDMDDDTAVAFLVALSLQNPRGVPSAVRTGLKRLAVSGDAGRRRRGALARSHAMLALARLGDGDGVAIATSIVNAPSEDANVRRSALLALGLLAPRLDDGERERVAKLFLVHARKGEPNTSGLALISVAKLVSARHADGGPSAATISTLETLVDFAVRGSFEVRPFAAIAVGLVARPIGKAIDDIAFIDAREKALDKLRRVYADDGDDPVMRGAFAIALGIAGDARARVQLEATIVSRRSHPDLAAYACAGLGLMGNVPRSSIAALRSGLTGRSSEILQFEAARALGLMGEAKTVPALVARLNGAATEIALSRAVTLLGAVGDGSAIEPMCTLARRTTCSDLTRALACVGLGLLGDAERTPSLARLGADSNYLARNETLQEVLAAL